METSGLVSSLTSGETEGQREVTCPRPQSELVIVPFGMWGKTGRSEAPKRQQGKGNSVVKQPACPLPFLPCHHEAQGTGERARGLCDTELDGFLPQDGLGSCSHLLHLFPLASAQVSDTTCLARPSRSFSICPNCPLCSSYPTPMISRSTTLYLGPLPQHIKHCTVYAKSSPWNALWPIFTWQTPIQPSKPQTRFVFSVKLCPTFRTYLN